MKRTNVGKCSVTYMCNKRGRPKRRFYFEVAVTGKQNKGPMPCLFFFSLCLSVTLTVFIYPPNPGFLLSV